MKRWMLLVPALGIIACLAALAPSVLPKGKSGHVAERKPAEQKKLEIPKHSPAAPKRAATKTEEKSDLASSPLDDYGVEMGVTGVADLEEGKGTITGFVKDTKGEPLVDCVVTLISKSGDEPIFTDKRGRFEFRRVPEGEFTILAEYAPQDGLYAPGTANGTIKGEETKNLEISIEVGGSASLVGRVFSDGGSLPSCEIRVYCDNGFQATSHPNPDGTYSILGLPDGSARVRVMLTEPTEVLAYDQSIDIHGGATLNPTIELKGRVALDVTVIGPDGQPLADADVALQHESIAGQASTDDSGKAHFEHLKPGKYVVYARAGEMTTQTTVSIPESPSVQLKLAN